jgi:hypothetical protein
VPNDEPKIFNICVKNFGTQHLNHLQNIFNFKNRTKLSHFDDVGQSGAAGSPQVAQYHL